MKIFNLAKRMSRDHELHLLTFYQKRDELKYLKDLDMYFKSISTVYQPKWKSVLQCIPAVFSNVPLQLAYFRNAKMHKELSSIIDQVEIDVVHTQHLRMSQYSKDLSLPKVLDLPDAFSLYWKRRKETKRPWYLRIVDSLEISRLVKAEKVIKEYDLSLVCSREDKLYLEKLHKANNLRISLNGVDLHSFNAGEGHDYSLEDRILFTGNMDYAPNVDAVLHFVDQQWAKILEERPNAKLIIAGQRPVSKVQNLADHNISVTGFVPDLSEMYANATVLIAPLRFGAGTQNKVLEAMAMGLPVVCTQVGFEGLEIKEGQGVLMGKTEEEFNSKLLGLLNSEKLRSEVGSQGNRIAVDRFSWDIVAQGLISYLNQARRS